MPHTDWPEMKRSHHVILLPENPSHYVMSPLVVSSLVEFEAVSSGTEVELLKKVTCSGVDIQKNKQYLVMGASGSEVTLSRGFKSVSFYHSLTCRSSSSSPSLM